MFAYCGIPISPNQLETGEGFLICRNVPIARIGEMPYMARELGIPENGTVTVKRQEEEVFSDASLASFEGKPVTDDHPPDLLTPDTYVMYAKGHAQNVRRGTEQWSEYVVADLHVQDDGLIRAIQDGKREVSCGYKCSYRPNGDGTYSQYNIRGNHVAIVANGRAGKNVAILDSIQQNSAANKPERKAMSGKSFMLKLLGMAAKDATPEELEQLAQDTVEALEQSESAEDGGIPKGGKIKEVKEKEETEQDEVEKSNMDAKLDTIIDLLSKQAAQRESQKVQDSDPLNTLLDSLEGKTADNSQEAAIIAEEVPESKGMDKAIAAGIIKTMRPVIAGIESDKERKRVTDSLIALLTDPGADSDLAKILSVSQKNAQKASDSSQEMNLDECQSAYDKLNPHRNGGNQ